MVLEGIVKMQTEWNNLIDNVSILSDYVKYRLKANIFTIDIKD